jgi:predicted TPR repeat methyltransferase
VSADTLVYFGSLEQVLAAAGKALRDGGLLAFTLEKNEDPSAAYLLHHRGRYSHSALYVQSSLQAAGLKVIEFNESALRMESGKPVAGFVVVAGKV